MRKRKKLKITVSFESLLTGARLKKTRSSLKQLVVLTICRWPSNSQMSLKVVDWLSSSYFWCRRY